jgi:hypothetical protein
VTRPSLDQGGIEVLKLGIQRRIQITLQQFLAELEQR